MLSFLILITGKGQSRVVTKTVPNDSFFNFFSPPDPNTFENKEEDEVDDLTIQLESDINRAEFIRDRLIPKAVLYFTGDIIDDDEDDDVDMGEDEDETDDSDGGDDYNPQRDVSLIHWIISLLSLNI
jgi:nucleosome assembly protein 1-like 1